MKITHWDETDIVHVSLAPDAEASSLELWPNVTAELNELGELIGLEILSASRFDQSEIRRMIETASIEVARARARVQEFEALTRMDGMDLDDENVMRGAWRK